jgi:hypothetical protein
MAYYRKVARRRRGRGRATRLRSRTRRGWRGGGARRATRRFGGAPMKQINEQLYMDSDVLEGMKPYLADEDYVTPPLE